ncbi:MAG TPA: SH3 domain-containing protein [Anaerolineales bacterium]
MKRPVQSLFIFLLAAVLAACNLPARPSSSLEIMQAQAGTIVAMTLQAISTRATTSTSGATWAIQNSPVPSVTPSPRVTATAHGTITPTYSVPMLTFDGNTNCRRGPGTDYKVVVVLLSGQKVAAVGVQGNYWIVKNPSAEGTCWVAADFATPTGSVWTLPTVTAPPLPTREPPAAPAWSDWNYTCAFASGGSTMTMNLLWTDRAADETGYKVYRDGQVVATLAANSTTFTEDTFVGTGKSLSYYVEAYSDSGKSDTSTIKVSCQ